MSLKAEAQRNAAADAKPAGFSGPVYPVEEGIALPPAGRPGAKYPFDQMRAGDSFFVPLEDAHPDSPVVAARNYGIRNGQRFTGRRLFDDGGELVGVRIWRTA